MRFFFWESYYTLKRAFENIVRMHLARAGEDGKTLYPCGNYPNLTTGNKGGSAYKEVDVQVVDTERTLFIVVWGQSNCAAYSGLREKPYDASSLVHMMDVHTGTIYYAQDPMLGCSGESQCYVSRLADKIISAKKFDRVIITNIALGSTQMSDWASSGQCSHRFDVAALRFRQNGWNPKHIAFLTTIGENDNIYGTNSKTYIRHSIDVLTKCRRVFRSQNAPFLLTQTSYILGKKNEVIRLAQKNFAENRNNVRIIADTDLYIGEGDRDGADHFSVATAERVASDCLASTLEALGRPLE